MSSFSCPHLEEKDNYCLRLKKDCVPGRAGCILKGKVYFPVPAEKRIEELEKEKARAAKPGECKEYPDLIDEK